MSILIKGMKMPKSCILEHGLTCEHFAHCDVADAKYRAIDARPKDCPLVEVPEPHGRLIDAATVEESICCHEQNIISAYSDYPYGYNDGIICAAAEVDDAPTVIEAEEQEHDCGKSEKEKE